MVKSMTEGNPMRLLALYAIPLLIGNLFQFLYTTIDTIIVGQVIGSNALAAVGAAGTPAMLFVGFAIGLSSAFTVKISQFFGEKNEPAIRNALGTSILISATCTVLLTVLGFLLAPHILRWSNTPDSIFSDSLLYLQIIVGGIFTTFFYNLLGAVIYALGDSRTPLCFLIISSILNVSLNLLLTVVIPLGIAGVAIATVFSQLIASFLCLLYLRKKTPWLRVHKEDWRVKKDVLKSTLSIGMSSGFRDTLVTLGGLLVQSLINSLGESVIAAHSIAGKVEMLVICIIVSIGSATMSYTGQNFGAKKWDRIRDGAFHGSFLCLLCSTIIGLLTYLFAEPLIGLFLKENMPEIVSYAKIYLRHTLPFLSVLALLNVSAGVVRGMGYSLLPFITGLLEIGARIGASFGLVGIAGYGGIAFANPAAWVLSMVITIPYAIYIFRRHRNANSTKLAKQS